MRISLILVSKNCDYINEYIDYYINIGFDHIYLIDNNEYEKKYIINNDKVSIFEYRGSTIYSCGPNGWRQSEILKMFMLISQDQGYDYCCIIDDDEYIDFRGNYNNIKDFLNAYKEYDTISLYWETITDNGYLYIDDEPKYNNSLREIYKPENKFGTYYKSIYKLPKSYNELKKLLENTKDEIVHCINLGNSIIIDFNESCVKHYITYCMERYLIKKVNYKGQYNNLSDSYLYYYMYHNGESIERMKAYVDLCNKYGIIMTDKDKEILNNNNIIY